VEKNVNFFLQKGLAIWKGDNTFAFAFKEKHLQQQN
jgi:hypothetical protein